MCIESLGEDMSTSPQGNKGLPRDTDRGRGRAGADSESGDKAVSTDGTSGQVGVNSKSSERRQGLRVSTLSAWTGERNARLWM